MNTCVDSYVPAIILSNIAVFVLSYVLDINSHSNTFSFEFKTGESCLQFRNLKVVHENLNVREGNVLLHKARTS